MDDNSNKYWVEDSDFLTDAEKLVFAQGLFELEREGVLEYRDGFWYLAVGVEIEETPDGHVARFRKNKTTLQSQSAQSSTPSSGEPSETRVLLLEQAAWPSSPGPGSPDSDDGVNKA